MLRYALPGHKILISELWGQAPTGEACRSTLKFAPCFLVYEQLSGGVKERHEKEKPLPLRSVVRSTDVRWAAVFLAYIIGEVVLCLSNSFSLI